jgi:hypothetical protein
MDAGLKVLSTNSVCVTCVRYNHRVSHLLPMFVIVFKRQRYLTILQQLINVLVKLPVIVSDCSAEGTLTLCLKGKTSSGVPRNFVQGSSTNSVEDRGQREQGSGGGFPFNMQ